MPRGGYRQGAGRKSGSVSKRNAYTALKASENGQTPVEFMLELMRAPLPPQVAERLKTYLQSEANPDPQLLAELRQWWAMRFEAAKGAAPFCHPRLNAVTNPQGDGPAEVHIRHFHEVVP